MWGFLGDLQGFRAFRVSGVNDLMSLSLRPQRSQAECDAHPGNWQGALRAAAIIRSASLPRKPSRVLLAGMGRVAPS